MAAERRVVVLAFDGVQILDVVGPLEVFDGHPATGSPRRTGSRSSRRRPAGPHDERDLDSSPTPGARRAAATRSTPSSWPAATGVITADQGRRARGRGPARRRRVPPSRVRLLRGVPAGRGGPARRPAGHHALERAVASSPASYPDLDRRRRSRSSSATATSTRPPGSPPASTSASRSSRRTTVATSRSSVARQLVVFLKRPGGQAQFSSHLSTQVAERDALADVQAWIADHLDEDLSRAAPRRVAPR